MRDQRRLVLFDIDGTLISAGGAGTRSMNLAFHRIFGVEDAFRGISMAGKTDIQIIKEGLLRQGFRSFDGKVESMRQWYLHYLRREIENPRRQLKPGIREALDLLRERKITLGLLTGNLREGALIKLGACGIQDYFVDGAYGSDHEDRNELLPIAIRKFRDAGQAFQPQECVVVGDTPRDVQCAKIHGGRSVAVSTGPYSMEDLRATDADVVFPTLEDRQGLLDFIGN